MIMKVMGRSSKGKWTQIVVSVAIAGILGVSDLFFPAIGTAIVSEAFTRGFSDIVEKVQPAVVNVAVSGGVPPGGPRRLPPGPFGGPPGQMPPGPFGGPPGQMPPGPFGGPPGQSPPMPGPPPGRPPGPPGMSAGSGVLISPDGYVVTNNHVVEDAEKINVTTFDGKEYRGKVVGVDPKTDLAVIKIEGDVFPFISWSANETIKVGDLVLAVGSPFGLKSSVTMGIISAMGRGNVGITDYEDFIQTDAPINPGNSGGPLVNMNGQIVGINTAIFSRTGGSQGIGFAIPVAIVKNIAQSLIQYGRVVRGWMGIAIQELNQALAQSFRLPEDNKGGVLISEVREDGPSADGLQQGDVMLEYRGEKLKGVNHLRHIVARTRVGDSVEIKVLRNGEEKTVIVKVGERPSDAVLARKESLNSPPSLENFNNVLQGLTVESLTDDHKKQFSLPEQIRGVVVSKVKPGSAAAEGGVQEGDVIQEVNREIIKNLSDYQNIASKIEQKELAVLLLSRRGNNLFVAINPK